MNSTLSIKSTSAKIECIVLISEEDAEQNKDG